MSGTSFVRIKKKIFGWASSFVFFLFTKKEERKCPMNCNIWILNNTETHTKSWLLIWKSGYSSSTLHLKYVIMGTMIWQKVEERMRCSPHSKPLFCSIFSSIFPPKFPISLLFTGNVNISWWFPIQWHKESRYNWILRLFFSKKKKKSLEHYQIKTFFSFYWNVMNM